MEVLRRGVGWCVKTVSRCQHAVCKVDTTPSAVFISKRMTFSHDGAAFHTGQNLV